MTALADAPESTAKRFYGKYRGTVMNNIDPMQIGRIMAIVPDVSGPVPTSWAMPCLPSAGLNTGVFTVPQIGAGVWMEFEQGDPDRPIWVGGYWGSAAEVPVLAHMVPPGVNGITIQTTLKNGIVVSDVPGPTGGIMIQTTTGAMISVSDVGIIISNGKGAMINMVGPSVDINVGALTVI
jgi:Type VI secretion system/phage-baseplate injector OB domain